MWKLGQFWKQKAPSWINNTQSTNLVLTQQLNYRSALSLQIGQLLSFPKTFSKETNFLSNSFQNSNIFHLKLKHSISLDLLKQQSNTKTYYFNYVRKNKWNVLWTGSTLRWDETPKSLTRGVRPCWILRAPCFPYAFFSLSQTKMAYSLSCPLFPKRYSGYLQTSYLTYRDFQVFPKKTPVIPHELTG